MAANWKIQNGPFGTLSEPELSQKKCSEQLRSRSIDWWRQMVHRTKIKIGKKVPGSQMDQKSRLGFSRVLLKKHVFWWFWAGFGLWELDFCSQNIFLVKILINFDILGFCQNFGFQFLIFSILSFFQIFWFSSISLQKWQPPYPGAIKFGYPEQ